MIVCSIPRCGATKFCIDLQHKTSTVFVGELNPLYMFANKKADYHETKYQQNYTPKQFASLLHDNKDTIVMVNKAPYLIIDRADYIILRKNMLDAFNSYANFIIKLYADINTNVIIKEVQDSIYDYYAVKAYIEEYKCDVIWYEDYFQLEGTSTPLLDNYKHQGIIKKAILNAFENYR